MVNIMAMCLKGFCAIVPQTHQHTYEQHPLIRFLDRTEKNPSPVSDAEEEGLKINAACALRSICALSNPSLLLYPSNTILPFRDVV